MMTNAFDLSLPPNALRIIVQGQASGRPPTVRDHPAGQPARTAKPAAAAKRTTTRSHSRQTMPKPVSESTHVRGVPAPKPSTRSPEVTPHQPLPANVRARRATWLAKPKASETAPAVLHNVANTILGRLLTECTTASISVYKRSTGGITPSQGDATTRLCRTVRCCGALYCVLGRAPKQHIWTILVSVRTVKEMSRLPGFDNLPVDLFEDVPEW